MKKLVYLISPNKINQNFYESLDKVLSFKNVKFFQLRLKNVSQKKLLNVSKKIKKDIIKASEDGFKLNLDKTKIKNKENIISILEDSIDRLLN